MPEFTYGETDIFVSAEPTTDNAVSNPGLIRFKVRGRVYEINPALMAYEAEIETALSAIHANTNVEALVHAHAAALTELNRAETVQRQVARDARYNLEMAKLTVTEAEAHAAVTIRSEKNAAGEKTTEAQIAALVDLDAAVMSARRAVIQARMQNDDEEIAALREIKRWEGIVEYLKGLMDVLRQRTNILNTMLKSA